MLKRVYRLNGVKMPMQEAIARVNKEGGIITITWEWHAWFREPDAPSIGADSIMELGMDDNLEDDEEFTSESFS